MLQGRYLRRDGATGSYVAEANARFARGELGPSSYGQRQQARSLGEEARAMRRLVAVTPAGSETNAYRSFRAGAITEKQARALGVEENAIRAQRKGAR